MNSLKVLHDFTEGNPIAVSNPVIVIPFAQLGRYDFGLLTIWNLDDTHPVTMIVNTSQSGVAVNSTPLDVQVAQPGGEASIDLICHARYYQLTCSTVDPFPTAHIRYELVVRLA